MPTPFDPETGELPHSPQDASDGGAALDASHPARGPRRGGSGRPKRVRTPEEEQVAAAEARHRAAVATALESVCPALLAEGDPPVRDGGLLPAAQVAPLLRLPRLSISGAPGSALVVSVREGDAGPYMLAHVEFHAKGYQFRTRGVAIQATEARAFARALLQWADERDAP